MPIDKQKQYETIADTIRVSVRGQLEKAAAKIPEEDEDGSDLFADLVEDLRGILDEAESDFARPEAEQESDGDDEDFDDVGLEDFEG